MTRETTKVNWICKFVISGPHSVQTVRKRVTMLRSLESCLQWISYSLNPWWVITLTMRQAWADDRYQTILQNQKITTFGISWPYLESLWEMHSKESKHAWYPFINLTLKFQKFEEPNRLLLSINDARILSVNSEGNRFKQVDNVAMVNRKKLGLCWGSFSILVDKLDLHWVVIRQASFTQGLRVYDPLRDWTVPVCHIYIAKRCDNVMFAIHMYVVMLWENSVVLVMFWWWCCAKSSRFIKGVGSSDPFWVHSIYLSIP